MMTLPIAISILLLGLMFWLQPKNELNKVYWIGISLKILAGWVLGWIYLIHYQSGDTLAFHRSATLLHQLSSESLSTYWDALSTANYPVFKGEARNELFVKLLSVLYLLTNGNYWVSSAILSVVSFSATWHFIKLIRSTHPEWLTAAIVSFLFIPSVVFWSSGVLKDTIIFSALCLLLTVVLCYSLAMKTNWAEICVTFLSLLLLFYLKFYLFATAAFCMGMLAWSQLIYRTFTRPYLRIIATLIGAVILGLLVTKTNWNLNIENLPQSIYLNHIAFGETADFTFSNLRPTYSSLMLNSTWALFTGLFRPLPWEAGFGQLLFSLEGILLALLIIVNLYYFREWKTNRIVSLTLTFVLILAVFLPLSTPNFGTLIRYRIVYFPLLTFVLLIIPSRRFLSKP